MIAKIMLHNIDRDFEKKIDWGCNIKCFCPPDLREIIGNPVKRYVCYKLHCDSV